MGRRSSSALAWIAAGLSLAAGIYFVVVLLGRSDRLYYPEHVQIVRFWITLSGVGAFGFAALGLALGRGQRLWPALQLGLAAGLGSLGAFLLADPAEWTWPVRAYRAAELEERMLDRYNLEQYAEAEALADRLLALDPDAVRAWIIKGGTRFYGGDYAAAASLFERAYALEPDAPYAIRNLGYAMVEIGQPKRAIELFQRLDPAGPGDRFALGRAHLYAGDYTQCLAALEGIPRELFRGAPAVLRAACSLALADSAPSPEARALGLERARRELRLGIEVEPPYWRGVISGDQPEKSMSFTRPLEILARLIEDPGVLKQAAPESTGG